MTDQDKDVQEQTQGQEQPRYVDPNSGAASQPGGQVAGGVVVQSEQPEQAEPAIDEAYDGAIEHSAGPAGEQPANPDGTNASETGQSEDSEGAGNLAQPSDGASEGWEKDYDEVLSGSVADVEKYVDEHPEEKDAVIAAESERDKPRKGVLEL